MSSSDKQGAATPDGTTPNVVLSSHGKLSVSIAPRQLTMHHVTSTELDAIASQGTSASLHFGFFGLAFGTLVSLGLTLATVQIQDPTTKAVMISLTVVTVVLCLYFGVSAYRFHHANSAKIRDIKSGID